MIFLINFVLVIVGESVARKEHVCNVLAQRTLERFKIKANHLSYLSLSHICLSRNQITQQALVVRVMRALYKRASCPLSPLQTVYVEFFQWVYLLTGLNYDLRLLFLFLLLLSLYLLLITILQRLAVWMVKKLRLTDIRELTIRVAIELLFLKCLFAQRALNLIDVRIISYRWLRPVKWTLLAEWRSVCHLWLLWYHVVLSFFLEFLTYLFLLSLDCLFLCLLIRWYAFLEI